jgi:hypothetical protein
MHKAYLLVAAVGFLPSSSLTFAQDRFFADLFNMSPKRKPNNPTGSLHSMR